MNTPVTRAVPGHAEGRAGRGSPLLLLGALILLWGLNWPAMKIVLAELPVLTFRTLCLAVAGAALLGVAAAGGERLRIPPGRLRPLLAASLFNIVGWYLFTAIGLAAIEAGRASIIAYSMPIWLALLARIVLGERLTGRRLAALGFGSAGLGLLVLPDLGRLGAAPWGALAMLAAALAWAAGTLVVKHGDWRMSTSQLTGWQFALGLPPFLVGALLLDPPGALFAMSAKTALVLVYVLVLPMTVAQWTWFKLLETLPAGVAAIAALAVPVVGLFSSTLLLGERLGAAEVSALVLVLAAIALVLGPQRRAA